MVHLVAPPRHAAGQHTRARSPLPDPDVVQRRGLSYRTAAEGRRNVIDNITRLNPHPGLRPNRPTRQIRADQFA